MTQPTEPTVPVNPPVGPPFGTPTRPRKPKRRWPWIAAAVAAGLLLLCGIGSAALFTGGDPDKVATTGATELPANTGSQPVIDEDTPEPAPTTEAAVDNSPAAFGRAHGWKYDDGLIVSVDSVKRFTPSQYAAGHTPGNTAVKVTITVINRTRAAFDCSLMQVHAAYGPNGVQAEDVFQGGLDGCIGSVAPGRSRTVTFGFSAKANPNPLQIGVVPTFDHEESLFEGKA